MSVEIEINWKGLATHGAKQVAILAFGKDRVGVAQNVLQQIHIASPELTDGEKRSELVWQCLNASVATAILEVFAEAKGSIPNPNELPNSIDETIIQATDIPFDFLAHPERPLLDWPKLVGAVCNALHDVGMVPKLAEELAGDLPDRFMQHLRINWEKMMSTRSGTSGTDIVHAFSQSALADAAERSEQWRGNRQSLLGWQKLPKNNPILGLPPQDMYLEPIVFEEMGRPKNGKRQVRWASAHDLIKTALTASDGGLPVSFVMGGPGCGKSTFARMLAAELARSCENRVVFLNLEALSEGRNALDQIANALSSDSFKIKLPENKTLLDYAENENRRLYVILAGVDQISVENANGLGVAGGTAISLADSFRASASAHALLLGRHIAVQQGTEGFGRQKPRIFEIPPLKLEEEALEETNWGEEHPPTDRRMEWWERYKSAQDQANSELATLIPGESLLRSGRLDGVTDQPVLNAMLAQYLNATGPTTPAEKFEELQSEEFNPASLYDAMLHGVFWNEWNQNTTLEKIGASDPEAVASFIILMEEVALATFQNDTRRASRIDVNRLIKFSDHHSKDSARQALALVVPRGSLVSFERALVTFYLRAAEGGSKSDQVFEFTHKSFAEYLLARRLLRAAAHTNQRALDESSSIWAKTFGGTQISRNAITLLRHEATRQTLGAKDAVESLISSLEVLAGGVIGHGFPVDSLGPVNSQPARQRDIEKRGAWAELCLMATLSALVYSTLNNPRARITWSPDGKRSPSPWGRDRIALLSLIQRVQTLQRGRGLTQTRSPIIQSICEFELSSSEPHFLQGANLQGASLQNTHLDHTNLRGANLEHANLQNSSLKGADLQGTNLKDANLEGADLKFTYLEGAKLVSANLQSANLPGANLRHSNLQSANLQGANLQCANLAGADLQGANLQSAYLGGGIIRIKRRENQMSMVEDQTEDSHARSVPCITILRDANLRYANLMGSILHNADLRYINLRGANLEGAELQEAELRGSNLQNATLQRANLQKAILHGADLRDAILRHADLKHADLRGAILIRSKLRHADLQGANLLGANLEGTDLQGATMPDGTKYSE